MEGLLLLASAAASAPLAGAPLDGGTAMLNPGNAVPVFVKGGSVMIFGGCRGMGRRSAETWRCYAAEQNAASCACL